MPLIQIHNCKTGEVIVRELTAEEITQRQIDAVNEETRQAEAEAKATAKVALLERLGITADEAKLLLS